MAIKHLLPRASKRPAAGGRAAEDWRALAESFEQFLADLWLPAKRALAERGQEAAGLPWVPEIDVRETAGEIVVTAALPGLEKSDIRVDVTKDHVSIRGRRAAPAEDLRREEQAHGYFCRRFQLPCEVKPAQAKARYSAGLLTVTMSKAGRAARSVKVE